MSDSMTPQTPASPAPRAGRGGAGLLPDARTTTTTLETAVSADLAPDTLVVVSGKLGRIVRASRIGPAHGYDVSAEAEAGNGYLPNFAPDWCVKPAELGVNVCTQPRGQHWCGLLHIAHPEWLEGSDGK